VCRWVYSLSWRGVIHVAVVSRNSMSVLQQRCFVSALEACVAVPAVKCVAVPAVKSMP
jgi:hypothetical protein